MNFPIRIADFSFNSKVTGKEVVLTLTSFSDRLVIVVSDLQKVGHVIDVYFPKAYAELTTVAYHRPEYETRVIFGPDTVKSLSLNLCNFFSG
jgi:hypothetical protein